MLTAMNAQRTCTRRARGSVAWSTTATAIAMVAGTNDYQVGDPPPGRFDDGVLQVVREVHAWDQRSRSSHRGIGGDHIRRLAYPRGTRPGVAER